MTITRAPKPSFLTVYPLIHFVLCNARSNIDTLVSVPWIGFAQWKKEKKVKKCPADIRSNRIVRFAGIFEFRAEPRSFLVPPHSGHSLIPVDERIYVRGESCLQSLWRFIDGNGIEDGERANNGEWSSHDVHRRSSEEYENSGCQSPRGIKIVSFLNYERLVDKKLLIWSFKSNQRACPAVYDSVSGGRGFNLSLIRGLRAALSVDRRKLTPVTGFTECTIQSALTRASAILINDKVNCATI